MNEVRNCSLSVEGTKVQNQDSPTLRKGLLKMSQRKSEAPGASLGKLEFFYVNCLRAFRSLFGIEADLVALGK
jgi:hypothetical protein